jgi:hypothetical protein
MNDETLATDQGLVKANQSDSNDTRWQKPDPDEARRRVSTRASLQLSTLLCELRHGPGFDPLGRARPRNRCERENELDGARMAYRHLADHNLVGLFPDWVYEEGRRGRGVT